MFITRFGHVGWRLVPAFGTLLGKLWVGSKILFRGSGNRCCPVSQKWFSRRLKSSQILTNPHKSSQILTKTRKTLPNRFLVFPTCWSTPGDSREPRDASGAGRAAPWLRSRSLAAPSPPESHKSSQKLEKPFPAYMTSHCSNGWWDHPDSTKLFDAHTPG